VALQPTRTAIFKIADPLRKKAAAVPDDPNTPAEPDAVPSLDGAAVDNRPVDPATGKPLPPAKPAIKLTQAPGEENGPKGPEPTRYGDWEKKGRCIDF
jgi:hypothetical protein